MQINKLKKAYQFLTDTYYKKIAVSAVLCAMLLQLFYIDPTNVISLNANLQATASVFSDDTPSDLVMILVEESLFADSQSYSNQYTDSYSEVSRSNIQDRVKRYAEDIQQNLSSSNSPGLEVSIVPVDKFQSVSSISIMLKQAYYQNLEKLNDSSLKGLITVGEVPLPIVNKDGNLFQSMYPYTDFENPQFVYNQSTSYFEPTNTQDPEPEVWHGVINLDTPDQIAEYFDKNHLHYQGVQEFSDFNTGIFFSEPHHDAKAFNQDLYSSYQTYTALIEEFAYNRYSRKLLDFLNQNADGFLAEAIQTTISNQDSVEIPDIFTKPSIEKFVTPITEVFTVALRDQRDALLSTGRYEDASYTTGLLGVAKLDELSSLYLKEVNQLIENEIDVIMPDIQQDITLTQGAKLTPVIQVQNSDGDLVDLEQEPIYFVNHSRQGDTLQLYLNLVPGLAQSTIGLPTDEIIDQIFTANASPLDEEDLIKNANLKINGTKFTDINTPAQCRLFRGGGTNNSLDKTVRTHRGLVIDRNPEVENPSPVCYKSYDQDDLEETWTKVDRGPGFLSLRDNVYKCTTFAGTDLQDFHRTDEVELEVQSPLTAESCYGMRTTNDYLDLLKIEYASTQTDEELAQAIQALNSIPNYQDLLIADYNGQSYTLQQVLENIPSYRSVKLNSNANFDWHAFSSQILANPVQTTFTSNIASTNTTPVQNIILKVEQYKTNKTIPSLIKHADPSPGIISNAYDSVNSDLPINATRYITFTDRTGQKQELIYPNLFKSNSVQEFNQSLLQIENALTNLSKSNQNYSGRLTSLVAAIQDNYESQSLMQASQSKVQFFIDWLNFDLNQKYEQAHRLLLNANPAFQVNNMPRSYEIAHLTGPTLNQNLDFNILDFNNYDQILPPEDSISKKHQVQTQQDLFESNQLTTDDSVDLFTYFTDYLPSWYEEQQEKVSRLVSPEKPEIKSIDEIFGSNSIEPTQVQITSKSTVNTINDPINLNLNLVNDAGISVLKNQLVDLQTNLPDAVQSQIDQDTSKDGVQIQFYSGQSNLNFKLENPGQYNFNLLSTNYTLNVYQNPKLKISTNSPSIPASSNTEATIQITLEENGASIPFPKPNLSLDAGSISATLTYQGENPSLSQQHIYTISAGSKAGEINLTATLPSTSIEASAYSLEITPGAVSKIKFTNPVTKVSSQSVSSVDAILVDEYGNTVYETATYDIEYDSTEPLSRFPQSANFILGKSTLEFQATPLSFGNVFFELNSPVTSAAGYHKIQISSELDLGEIGPNLNSLVLNLFTDSSYVDSSQLNGVLTDSKVQTISTLSSDLTSGAPLLYIHASGGALTPRSSQVLTQTSFENGVLSRSVTDNQSNSIAEVSVNISDKPLVSTDNQEAGDELLFEPISPNLEINQTSVQLDKTTLISLNPNQTIQEISPEVTLVSVDDTYFKTQLVHNGQVIASLKFVPTTTNQVTIKPNSRNSNVLYSKAKTLPSTTQPEGLKFYNPKLELSSSQKPYSPDLRGEDSLENPRVGLVQGSKLVHLLASSVPVGAANQPHLSESGVVLGDPAIKLPYQQDSSLSNMNFNDTIGQYITRKTDSELVDIVQLPEYEKSLIAYKDGTVGLLDHTTLSYTPNILQVPNGIQAVHQANFQEDSSTVLFQTDQACFQDDTCLYVFNPHDLDQKTGQTQSVSPNLASQDGYELDRNKLSTLNRLDLDLDTKVKQVLVNDMNQDGLDDLLVEASDQIIYLFWNQSGQIQSTPNPLGHTRTAFNDEEYLLEKTLVSNIPTTQGPSAELNIPVASNPITNTFQTPSGPIQSEQIQNSQRVQLHNVTSFDFFSSSTAKVVDIDGNTLENGDILEYTLFLSNSSTTNLSNLSLSIPIPTNQLIKPNTLSPQGAKFIQTTDTGIRKYLIESISIPSSSTQTITFQTTYVTPDNSQPSIIKINPASEESIFPVQDGYPDLKVLVPGSNNITYFYSDYDSAKNVLSFNRQEVEQVPQVQSPNKTTLDTVLNLPANPTNQTTEQQEQVANSLAEQTLQNDTDGDGIIDIYDGTPTLSQSGSAVEKAIKDLSCGDGGCLAVPKNKAFLVPGDIPGTELPAFAWGCPPLPTGAFIPLWPPQPFQSCSGGRIYVSPTLTGEFAGSVCVGPHRLGACFTFSIADLGALCDTINKSIQDVITNASDFVETKSGGAITVGGSSNQNQESNIEIPGFPSTLTNWLTDQWKELNKKLLNPPDINIIYPDPQSVIGYVTPTNQQDQRNYIFTDPYPNCNSLQDYQDNKSDCGSLSSYNDVLVAKANAKSRAEFNSADDLKNILEEVALMPLFDINYETVYVNYPWIQEKELTKYKTELTNLKDQIKLEVLVKGGQWGCFTDLNYNSVASIQTALDNGDFLNSIASVSNQNGQIQAACLRLAAGLEGIDLNIKENFKRIQSYREIPKNIVRAENFVANYADQVLQYSETILSTALGWLTENTSRINQWEQAIHDVESMADELKVMLDFSADFMEACDDCRSNRTNDGIESIISIFANLAPDLPVIEIPSWPDITLDVSEIKAGIDVSLPDFEFKKDPITLPDLDLEFKLPNSPTTNIGITGQTSGLSTNGISLEAYLQAFEVPLLPAPPNIDELEIMKDLPDLPALEIPELPSLPKPPSINDFTGNFTQKIEPTLKVLTQLTRIYCLISKGLVPMPETQIKSQIETMTNRPLTPVLPIDISFQTPASQTNLEYIEEIIFKLTTQLNFEFDQIQTGAQEIANSLNQFSSSISNDLENALQQNFQFLDQGEINVLGEDLTNTTENLGEDVDIDANDLTSFTKTLNEINSEAQKLNQEIPSHISLKANSKPYIPSSNPTITLQDYKSHPLIQKKNAQIKTSSQFASTNNVSNKPPIKSKNLKLTNQNLLAQATPSQTASVPEYDPEEGVYTIDEQGTVQKLINYNSPLQSKSQVEIVDLDKDGDEDILYSLENSLFIKKNNHVTQSSTIRSSSPRIFEFNDLLKSASLPTVSTPELSFSFQHNQVNFTLPDSLQNQTVVLDVYKLNLEEATPYQRYSISPDQTSNLSIPKDQFSRVIHIQAQSQASIPLSNGNYLARLSYLSPDTLDLSVIQSNIALTPNTCGDTIPPNILLNSDQQVDVPLFGTYTVDLSGTYDSESSVKEIYIDNNLTQDLDQDGDKTNDKNIQGTTNKATAIFQLGPFDKIETKKYKIHALDINQNHASVLLTLNVIPPDITISEGQNKEVNGQLDPVSGNTPITLVRQRDGVLSPIAELNTDSNGQFQFTPKNNSDSIVIKDINQREIYRIHKTTGTIQVLDPNAKLEFSPWSQDVEKPEENQNTSISLLYGDTILTKVQKVSDSAIQPIISSQPVSNSQLDSVGLYIQDTNPASWNAFLTEGQIAISKQSQDEPSVLITADGQISQLDQSTNIQISAAQTINDLQTYDIYADSILQFSVFVNPTNPLQVQDPTEVRSTTTKSITFTPPKPAFQDIAPEDNSYEAIRRLQSLGIIEGVQRDNQIFFEPDRSILRSEFSKIILEALCLSPSSQAKLPPQAFSDIPYQSQSPLWYYDYTKETQLLGLFNGYLAEQDPGTNLYPFKPNNSITLAESAKVIIEALELKSIIQFDLPSTNNGPWYVPYLEIAEDLTPYITTQAQENNSLKNNQLLTPGELQNPNQTITREEFAVIASRVLDLYNCFEVESNTDNNNQDSNQPGTNQDNSDGSSQSENTNPEFELIFPSPQRPGLYIDQIACNTCPCAYTIHDENDIINRDIIFAVLLGPNQEVYSQSNLLKISQ